MRARGEKEERKRKEEEVKYAINGGPERDRKFLAQSKLNNLQKSMFFFFFFLIQ